MLCDRYAFWTCDDVLIVDYAGFLAQLIDSHESVVGIFGILFHIGYVLLEVALEELLV